MKTILFFSSLVTLTLIACMKEFSESVHDEKAGLNGSFEISKNQQPVNWLLYTQKTTGEGNFRLTLDKTFARSGQQSLRFDVLACSDEGGWKSPGISQEIPARAGEQYVLKAWIKNQGSEFVIRFNGVSAFEKSRGVELRSGENNSDWQNLELSVQVPENMDRLRVELNLLKPGTFWIDDIDIRKAERP